MPPCDLPSQLTPSQREAILHGGSPLLIIAGPGSGKTEVITGRVAFLVESGRVDPPHCLVTTFSNKASLELKDRIQKKLPAVNVEQMRETEIAQYEGRHDDLIHQAPALSRLLCDLLDDKRLPGRLRPLVSCAIAYFILPGDVVPEAVHGPYGLIDDIWLSAWALNTVRRETEEDDDLLTDNWHSEAPLLPLLADILVQEQELIGGQGKKILAYTGCDRVVSRE